MCSPTRTGHLVFSEYFSDILVRSQVSGPSSEPGTLLTEVLTISQIHNENCVCHGIFGLVSWFNFLILKITCVFFRKIQTGLWSRKLGQHRWALWGGHHCEAGWPRISSCQWQHLCNHVSWLLFTPKKQVTLNVTSVPRLSESKPEKYILYSHPMEEMFLAGTGRWSNRVIFP